MIRQATRSQIANAGQLNYEKKQESYVSTLVILRKQPCFDLDCNDSYTVAITHEYSQ